MNVIVSNKQKGIIDNANIDAIKDLNGLFVVDDLLNKFKNYFFSKMILDATSVVDFATKDVLQKLATEIGPDRLIILLPSIPEPPDEFKKLLIDLKIYNFSNNIDDVVRFIEQPNTYENAMSTIKSSYNNDNDYYVDSSIKDGEDETIDDNMEQAHSSLGDAMNQLNVYDDVDNGDTTVNTHDNNVESAETKVESEVSEEENTSDTNHIAYNNKDTQNVVEDNTDKPIDDNEANADSVTHVFLNMDGFDTNDFAPKEKQVIGFKNVTEHAGSTTLIYLLQEEAKKRNKDVISIEIDKNDFKLFRSNKMIGVKEEELTDTLDKLNESYVLVDLNDCKNDSFCSEIVYLVEPSLIKLNKLMMMDKETFVNLKDKKVILNQSMLSDKDVSILEKEANMTFFFNVGSINDRLDNSVINELFDKLVKE